MVLRAMLGIWRILWVSDAGWFTEMDLLEQAVDIRCDILIQSRHESDTSCSTAFLQKASPRLIISASDPSERQRHIPQQLRTWCTEQHVPLLDPHVTGSVLLELQPRELRVTTRLSSSQHTLKAHEEMKSR
jgi:competence protein ComEC